MQYPVELALEDYLTVIFSGIGLILLTKMVFEMDRTLGRMALIGSILTISGGALKATGKLVMSMDGPDLPYLNLGLFPLIAPGFTLVGWSLFQVRKIMQGRPVSRQPWLVPAIVLGVFALGSGALFTVGGPWRVPLILLSSVANISLLVMLAIAAWKRDMKMASVFYITTLVVVLVMSQMAQIKFDNLGVIWFEQLSQTFAQALFAFASWKYGHAAVVSYRSSPALQMA
ncbi:hypothetical protein [Candidatus Oscillochloris fontis]|uniref:hypothetical protein n=1 Tax=Candidatus Oscillochloris fontis TaxID=2496868 RepID=UPI00101B8510|nr:hypothetical protein [Candidatus Oscillochloris fontis]